MDYSLLFATFERGHRERNWPRQRLLHECLRAAIRTGVLAQELGLARNTVLYAYEQLASEGFVLAGRSGTVVAGSAGVAVSSPASSVQIGLSRRATHLRGVAGQDGSASVVFPAD